jgi:hypothetical protein
MGTEPIRVEALGAGGESGAAGPCVSCPRTRASSKAAAPWIPACAGITNLRRQFQALIARSNAKHRVSKDRPAPKPYGLWSVLRDATLHAAPQDEGVARSVREIATSAPRGALTYGQTRRASGVLRCDPRGAHENLAQFRRRRRGQGARGIDPLDRVDLVA